MEKANDARPNINQEIIDFKKINKIAKKLSSETYKYIVLSCFLFSKPEKATYGKFNILASYDPREEAEEFAESLSKKTNLPGIIVYKTCRWWDLDVEINVANHNKFLRIDLTKDHIHKKLKEMTRNDDLEKRPNTIEHYAGNWLKYIDTAERIQQYKKQISRLEGNLKTISLEIKEQVKKDPKLSSKFLPVYKQKMEKSYTGGRKKYRKLKYGYGKYKNRVFMNEHKIKTSILEDEKKQPETTHHVSSLPIPESQNLPGKKNIKGILKKKVNYNLLKDKEVPNEPDINTGKDIPEESKEADNIVIPNV